MRSIAAAGGIVLVVATLASVVGTLVVPRAIPSRLVWLVGNGVNGFLRVLCLPFRRYETKDRVLSRHGALWLLALLAAWLSALCVGYALLIWSVSPVSFAYALQESGSSLVTLGFVSPRSPGSTVVGVVAGASGLVIVALQIAYLPVLYDAFSRRETMITTLQSRAGVPAWGPEILWRHQRVDIVDSLGAFYADWEKWCADVAETHATYPVLIYFRSPHHLRSWVTGLIAVLDSAAMYLSLSPKHAPSEARLCLRMGFTCFREIADVLRLEFDPDPAPDTPLRLTFEEFSLGVELVREAGLPIERDAAAAWPHFRGWRVNYESVAYAIADRVVAAPGPWTGKRRALGDLVIQPRRPLDRTPDQPEGTDVTRFPTG